MKILLTKICHIRNRCAKQLGDDRGDTLKVARPHRAFEPIGEIPRRNVCLEAWRVHRRSRGGIDGIDTGLIAGNQIVVDWSRVAIKIGRLIELQRIDENRHDHDIGA